MHLPWCVRKCPYCDFNSYQGAGDSLPFAEYVAALLRDLDWELAQTDRDFEASSIYLGGGTPSLFPGFAIEVLLTGIRDRVRLAPATEVTLEANPGGLDVTHFPDYLAAGVTRLSVGVQSFRDDMLLRLGRVHDGIAARDAVGAAIATGFPVVNLDLMYGLPGDSLAGGLADLEAGLKLGTSHLSWYELTIEPNTAFYRQPPALPREATTLALEDRGREMLDAVGLQRYEISAYARPGHECEHNLNYWRFGDYIGIGAGAHGKRSMPSEAGGEARAIVRTSRVRNPRSYMQTAGTAKAVSDERVAGAGAIVTEYLMNALRLPGGVSVADFQDRTGCRWSEYGAISEAAIAAGLLDSTPGQIRPTRTGLRQLNRLIRMYC